MANDDAARRAEFARVRRVRDRIDRDHAQPLNVEALARGAHLSAGHLSRAFAGVPPIVFVDPDHRESHLSPGRGSVTVVDGVRCHDGG